MSGLLMIGLAAGRVLPPLVARTGGDIPVPDWSPALVLAIGAALVAMTAWQTWRTLHREKKSIASRHAIRVLAIAKSSVIVGAIFAGGYAGFALAFYGVGTEFAELRFWRGLAAALAGLALVGAALALEWACQLPEGDDEEPEGTEDAALA